MSPSGRPSPGAASADPWLGRVVDGGWKIVSLLDDSGGMATVYLAEHLHLRHRVDGALLPKKAVVKVPKPHLLNTDFLERFAREATGHATATHRNVVKILNYGEEAGTPYLVLEYLPGGNLEAWCSRHASMLAEPRLHFEAWLLPIAEALDAVAAQGLVHRDVKPTNILFDAAGRGYLSDFGIVKVAGEGTLLRTGHFIGTLQFMSPEQCADQSRQSLDGRSDQYGLAVTVYQVLTAWNFPVDGDTAVLASKFGHVAMKQPREHVPLVPQAVNDAVMRALSLDREQRFDTNVDFANAVVRGFGVTPPPPPPPRPPRPPRPRRARGRRVAIAAGAAVVVGLSAFVMYVASVGQPDRSNDRQVAERARPPNPGESLKPLAPVSGIRQRCQLLSDPTAYVRMACLSPDGTMAAVEEREFADASRQRESGKARVSLWNVETGRRLRVLDGHDNAISCLAFSSDGRLIASGGRLADMTLRTWDVATGELRCSSQKEKWSPVYAKFLGTGRNMNVLFVDAHAGIRRMDLPRCDSSASSIDNPPATPWCCDVSADGRKLVMGCQDGLRMLDLGGGRQVWHVPLGREEERRFTAPATAVALSADGNEVLAAVEEMQFVADEAGRLDSDPPWQPRRVRLSAFSAATGARRRDFHAHEARIDGVRFLEPATFMSCDDSGLVVVWDVKAGQPLLEQRVAEKPRRIEFSADNRRILLSGSQTVTVWDIER